MNYFKEQEERTSQEGTDGEASFDLKEYCSPTIAENNEKPLLYKSDLQFIQQLHMKYGNDF